jgi:hypothetical protein
LQSCKDVIVGTPALSITFDAAVTYATWIVSELKSLTDYTQHNISLMSSGRTNHNEGRGHGAPMGRGGRGGRFGRGGRGGRGGCGGRGGRGGCGGHGNSTSTGQITDRCYTDQAWRALTPDDQLCVRDKREDRDRRRGLQAVQRNVRPRLDTNTDEKVSTDTGREHGIGAVMSRRQAHSSA